MGWYNSSWQYRVKVTVLAAQVDANLTGFPVYVDLSDLPAGFHTNVNQTDARDIRVTLVDGSTEVPREVVFYDSTTDTGELHFKASVDGGTDTDFYIYYGNAGASEPAVDSTYGRNAVWSDYEAVYHLSEDPSTTNALDSTGNGYSGTPNGSMTSGDLVDGKLGKALDFDGVNDSLVMGDVLDVGTNDFEISYQIKTAATPANYAFIASKAYAAAGSYRYATGIYGNPSKGRVFLQGNGGGDVEFSGTTTVNDNTWRLLHYSFDRDANATIFVNGSSDGSQSIAHWSAANFNSNHPFRIGAYTLSNNVDPTLPYGGLLDEFRIRFSLTSSSWKLTEYNNQNSPSTFYSVGVQEVGVNTETKTVQAKARIKKNSNTKTSQAKARIQDTGITKTVSTKAKIVKQSDVTVSAKSKVVFYGEWSDVWDFTVKNVTEQEKTVSAKAKILVRESKDISAKSRILNTYDSTVQSKARIKESQEQDISAKSRIKDTGEVKTVQSKSRIKIVDNEQSVQVKARIQRSDESASVQVKSRIKRESEEATVSAKARIESTGVITSVEAKSRIKQEDVTKTVSALARLLKHFETTVSAKARLKFEIEKDISAKARILSHEENDVSAKARIKNQYDSNVSVKSRIQSSGEIVNVQAKARIKQSEEKTVSVRSRIKKLFENSISSLARILRIEDSTVSALSRIKATQDQSVSAKLRIKDTGSIENVQARSRIKILDNEHTIESKSRIKKEFEKTVTARAKILRREQNEISVKSRILRTFEKTVYALARILLVHSETVSSKARIKTTEDQSVSAKLRIKDTGKTYSISALSRIKHLDNDVQVSAKARIKHIDVDSEVSAQARIKKEIEKTVSAKSRVKKIDQTKLVGAKSRIKKLFEGSVSAKARIQITVDNEISAKARIYPDNPVTKRMDIVYVVSNDNDTFVRISKVKTNDKLVRMKKVQ